MIHSSICFSSLGDAKISKLTYLKLEDLHPKQNFRILKLKGWTPVK